MILKSLPLLIFGLLLTCNVVAQIEDDTSSVSNESSLFQLLQIRYFGFEFFNRLEKDSLTQLRNVTSDENMNKCVTQLLTIRNGIYNNEMWAIKFLDSWGKIPSGILHGHLMEMGNFDECMQFTHEVTASIEPNGKYCMTEFPLEKFLNLSIFDSVLKLQIGICIPESCKAEHIDRLLKYMLSSVLHLNDTSMHPYVFVKERNCQIKEKVSLKTIDWVAIAILILIGILLGASTVYDYVKTQKQSPLNPLYASFSVRSNLRHLFHVTSSHNAPHVIPCLNGIRSLSIIWVIFGHSYFLFLLSPNMNNIDIIAWAQSPFSMFLQRGTISVDSFFFLSGLLLFMAAFRQMKKTSGKINVPLMYLHRYLRLTPVLALAILLFVSLSRYLCHGPLCQNYNSSWKACEDTWWSTLLYVQNYATPGKMCLGHSWYLAVDMQLFLFSPLILISIWKWKRKGLAGVLLIGALLFACLFSSIVIKEYSVENMANMFVNSGDDMYKIYYSTHSRALPWIIGIVFGYYLHNQSFKRKVLSKIAVALGWVLAVTIFITVLFALYPTSQQGARPLTALEGAFYLSLSRIAWPIGLAWVVFACVNGYGGPINQFLSWSFWEPLSRLSYCMYIWHILIESINLNRIKTNLYFSDYDAILRFWSTFGITICISILMYVAIEAPMIGIEKFLFAKDKGRKTKLESNLQVQPVGTAAQTTID